MTESLRKFIRDHAENDVSQLLLNASRYPEVDMKEAVIQIMARKQIKDKIPAWYKDERLIFPSTLAGEQCSSETTALYKKRLVQTDDRICDLTGGMGVDTYYLSQKVKRVTYVEKNKACCDAARANFRTLRATNVHVINKDAIDYLKNKDEDMNGINVFYIDPDRRGKDNRRLFAINDCEPVLNEIIALMPEKYRIIIKLSPMLDITQALSQIPSVREVHILSVKNECKELLLVAESAPFLPLQCNLFAEPESLVWNRNPCESLTQPQTNPDVYCVNYMANGVEQSFCFRLADERAAVAPMAKKIGRFLYEPNASLLKAGAFKLIAVQYGVEKLHASTHLYTSNQPVMSFPGSIFEVTDVLPFNNRICKTISSTIPRANISVRNFPVSVDELRKRTRIGDGGDVYLYATTLPDNQKALIINHKLQLNKIYAT